MHNCGSESTKITQIHTLRSQITNFFLFPIFIRFVVGYNIKALVYFLFVLFSNIINFAAVQVQGYGKIKKKKTESNTYDMKMV